MMDVFLDESAFDVFFDAVDQEVMRMVVGGLVVARVGRGCSVRGKRDELLGGRRGENGPGVGERDAVVAGPEPVEFSGGRGIHHGIND